VIRIICIRRIERVYKRLRAVCQSPLGGLLGHASHVAVLVLAAGLAVLARALLASSRSGTTSSGRLLLHAPRIAVLVLAASLAVLARRALAAAAVLAAMTGLAVAAGALRAGLDSPTVLVATQALERRLAASVLTRVTVLVGAALLVALDASLAKSLVTGLAGAGLVLLQLRATRQELHGLRLQRGGKRLAVLALGASNASLATSQGVLDGSAALRAVDDGRGAVTALKGHGLTTVGDRSTASDSTIMAGVTGRAVLVASSRRLGSRGLGSRGLGGTVAALLLGLPSTPFGLAVRLLLLESLLLGSHDMDLFLSKMF